MKKTFILTLLNTPGFGRKTIEHVLDSSIEKDINSIADLQNLLKKEGESLTRLRAPSAETLKQAHEKALRILDKSESQGINVLGYNDPSFPEELKEIPEKSILLHVKGDLEALKKKFAVAIVGTRTPTKYGEKASRRLAEIFAKKGYTIISGLAKGCDTSAHEGCLDAKGTTVAILASGVDYIYPRENKNLAMEILENNGCLVSEYAIGEKPQRSYFPARDRLQSGLSKGLIVIETDYQGGTMHTVNYAIKQRKKLACLTGHPPEYINSSSIRGSYSLIKEDIALSIGSPEEIQNFIEIIDKDPIISKLENKNQAVKIDERPGDASLFD